MRLHDENYYKLNYNLMYVSLLLVIIWVLIKLICKYSLILSRFILWIRLNLLVVYMDSYYCDQLFLSFSLSRHDQFYYYQLILAFFSLSSCEQLVFLYSQYVYIYFLYKQCSLYSFIYRPDKDIFSYHIIARIDNNNKKISHRWHG
jgi:hypothetical protein